MWTTSNSADADDLADSAFHHGFANFKAQKPWVETGRAGLLGPGRRSPTHGQTPQKDPGFDRPDLGHSLTSQTAHRHRLAGKLNFVNQVRLRQSWPGGHLAHLCQGERQLRRSHRPHARNQTGGAGDPGLAGAGATQIHTFHRPHAAQLCHLRGRLLPRGRVLALGRMGADQRPNDMLASGSHCWATSSALATPSGTTLTQFRNGLFGPDIGEDWVAFIDNAAGHEQGLRPRPLGQWPPLRLLVDGGCPLLAAHLLPRHF